MIDGFAAIRGADRKNEMFKQRPFLVAHQVSGQADLHNRYQLESRQCEPQQQYQPQKAEVGRAGVSPIQSLADKKKCYGLDLVSVHSMNSERENFEAEGPMNAKIRTTQTGAKNSVPAL